MTLAVKLGCFIYENERVRGIEPPCAAWEAAVLPLNYTRMQIFDFRFAIADCNRNKWPLQIAVACAALSARKIDYQCFPGNSGRYNGSVVVITATKSRRRRLCQRSCQR